MECIGVRPDSGLQKAMAEEVLALLDVEGSERILDVGCGDGRSAPRLLLAFRGARWWVSILQKT